MKQCIKLTPEEGRVFEEAIYEAQRKLDKYTGDAQTRGKPLSDPIACSSGRQSIGGNIGEFNPDPKPGIGGQFDNPAGISARKRKKKKRRGGLLEAIKVEASREDPKNDEQIISDDEDPGSFEEYQDIPGGEIFATNEEILAGASMHYTKIFAITENDGKQRFYHKSKSHAQIK